MARVFLVKPQGDDQQRRFTVEQSGFTPAGVPGAGER